MPLRPVWLSPSLLAGFSSVVLLLQLWRNRSLKHKLKESEGRRYFLLEHAPDAILFIDPYLKTVVYANAKAGSLFGVTVPELKRLGLQHFYHSLQPDRRPFSETFQEHIDEALTGGEVVFERHIVTADGRELFCEVQVSRMPMNPKLIHASFVDVTKYKQAELRLRDALDEAQRFREALDHLSTYIYMKDIHSHYTYANKITLDLFQCSAEEVVGADDSRFFPPDIVKKLREVDQQVLKGKNTSEVIDFKDPDGKRHVYLEVKTPIYAYGEPPSICGLYGISTDITSLRQVEEALQVSKNVAEQANRAKGIFLAKMSHEFRTPLNAILGFSELLQHDPDLSGDQKEMLATIRRSGDHLLSLINDILDMSKIEAEQVELRKSSFNLGYCLQEVKSIMGGRAADKGLSFTTEGSDVPQYIIGDEGKLRQILINLIANAIKYTPRGGIIFRARKIEEKSRKPTPAVRLRFEIEDSGIGIKREDLKRIFLPFVQLGSRSTVEEGTGLGLAITSQYVKLMGGEVEVKSEPNKGSTFSFEIEAQTSDDFNVSTDTGEKRRVVGLAKSQEYRILIAEDQPENLLLLKKQLRPLGLDLREARNGQEAVEIYKQWHPHFIWMDINMPVVDGKEATQTIRAIEEEKAYSKTPIVALTAHALEEERHRILAAGCDSLIQKPYRESEIFEAMAKYLGLNYIYQEEREGGHLEEDALLRSERLAMLPKEILSRLHQALIELDMEQIARVIQEITRMDRSIGMAMASLARELKYDRLLIFLQGVGEKEAKIG